MSATGGDGGVFDASYNVIQGGSGMGGDINTNGDGGIVGSKDVDNDNAAQGEGGGTVLGGSSGTALADASKTGVVGSFPGGGGSSGATDPQSGSNTTGGDGADGVVIVRY
jgi:hypothetical protein